MGFPSKSFEVELCQRKDVACRPAIDATSRLGRTNLAATDILSTLSLFAYTQLSTQFCSGVDQMFNI